MHQSSEDVSWPRHFDLRTSKDKIESDDWEDEEEEEGVDQT